MTGDQMDYVCIEILPEAAELRRADTQDTRLAILDATLIRLGATLIPHPRKDRDPDNHYLVTFDRLRDEDDWCEVFDLFQSVPEIVAIQYNREVKPGAFSIASARRALWSAGLPGPEQTILRTALEHQRRLNEDMDQARQAFLNAGHVDEEWYRLLKADALKSGRTEDEWDRREAELRQRYEGKTTSGLTLS